MLGFEGQAVIHRIAPTPSLMVVPGNDITVRASSQLQAFAKTKEPKELHYMEGLGHFDVYLDGFEETMNEFLHKHICK